MLKTRSSTFIAPVLAISHGHPSKKKKISHTNGKGKARDAMPNQGLKRKVDSDKAPTTDPKEAICFCYQEKGHWKHSCPEYLQELKQSTAKRHGTLGIFVIILDNMSTSNSQVIDTKCGTHIYSDMQELKESKKQKHGELILTMGNRSITPVTRIRDYEIMVSSGVLVILLNCYYSPNMA